MDRLHKSLSKQRIYERRIVFENRRYCLCSTVEPIKKCFTDKYFEKQVLESCSILLVYTTTNKLHHRMGEVFFSKTKTARSFSQTNKKSDVIYLKKLFMDRESRLEPLLPFIKHNRGNKTRMKKDCFGKEPSTRNTCLGRQDSRRNFCRTSRHRSTNKNQRKHSY